MANNIDNKDNTYGMFKITDCDFERRTRTKYKEVALRFYGTMCGDA